MNLPSLGVTWFNWLAVVWSAYQCYAGWHYGLHIASAAKPAIPESRRHRVYGLHHGLWYFACSFAGFMAWSLFASFVSRVSDPSVLSAGGATLLLALGAVSVLGVSGALARMLFVGQKLL